MRTGGNNEMGMTISICTGCLAGQTGLAADLLTALEVKGLHARIVETGCMSGCARPSTIAFRADGKTAYLFGEINSSDMPELLHFATLYAASPDGNFADARPLGALRSKAIARIPG